MGLGEPWSSPCPQCHHFAARLLSLILDSTCGREGAVMTDVPPLCLCLNTGGETEAGGAEEEAFVLMGLSRIGTTAVLVSLVVLLFAGRGLGARGGSALPSLGKRRSLAKALPTEDGYAPLGR